MNRKINIDRPNLSSQEIASRQDFSSLMKQLPKVTKPPFYKTGWFITTLASVAGIAVITTNFVLNDKTSTPNQEIATAASTENLPENKSSTEFVDPIKTSNNDELAITFTNEKETVVDENKIVENVSNDQILGQLNLSLDEYKGEVLKTKAAYEEAKNIRINFEKNAPNKPIQNGNSDRQFVLDANPKDFPELASYKNLLFEVEANDPNFTPSVYDEEWEDIQLKTNVPGKTYYLSLYRGNISKTFSVFPIYQGSNYDTALDKYNQNLVLYKTELQLRIDQEENLKHLYEQSLNKLKEIENQEAELSKTN